MLHKRRGSTAFISAAFGASWAFAGKTWFPTPKCSSGQDCRPFSSSWPSVDWSGSDMYAAWTTAASRKTYSMVSSRMEPGPVGVPPWGTRTRANVTWKARASTWKHGRVLLRTVGRGDRLFAAGWRGPRKNAPPHCGRRGLSLRRDPRRTQQHHPTSAPETASPEKGSTAIRGSAATGRDPTACSHHQFLLSVTNSVACALSLRFGGPRH